LKKQFSRKDSSLDL